MMIIFIHINLMILRNLTSLIKHIQGTIYNTFCMNVQINVIQTFWGIIKIEQLQVCWEI